MRLSGFSNVYHGVENRTFQAANRSTKSSFWDAVQKATDVVSVKKVRDSIEKSSSMDLQSVYNQLTSGSKATLDCLNTEEPNIGKDEWMGLCEELKDMGKITEYDFSSVRSDFHSIPIGYYDENGNIVTYEACPMTTSRLLELYEKSRSPALAGPESWLSIDDWSGDPLEDLDSWVSALYRWRSDLARMRAEDGSPKYNDFTPITDQINSCQKVVALVKNLAKFN